MDEKKKKKGQRGNPGVFILFSKKKRVFFIKKINQGRRDRQRIRYTGSFLRVGQ